MEKDDIDKFINNIDVILDFKLNNPFILLIYKNDPNKFIYFEKKFESPDKLFNYFNYLIKNFILIENSMVKKEKCNGCKMMIG
jgi:hypothetical protein